MNVNFVDNDGKSFVHVKIPSQTIISMYYIFVIQHAKNYLKRRANF